MFQNYFIEIVYTFILIITAIIIVLYFNRAIERFSFIKSIELNRRKIVYKLFHLGVYIIAGIGLLGIWGVNMEQFSVFISSALAVIGIAFFAQWSLLSNLTASVILFFNHPVRLGNRVRILDKDFDWTGRVVDITGFYLFMITDDGREITIPNSIVLQKGIEILDNNAKTNIITDSSEIKKTDYAN